MRGAFHLHLGIQAARQLWMQTLAHLWMQTAPHLWIQAARQLRMSSHRTWIRILRVTAIRLWFLDPGMPLWRVPLVPLVPGPVPRVGELPEF